MQRSPFGHLPIAKSGPSQVPQAAEATDAVPTLVAQGEHRDTAKTQMLQSLCEVLMVMSQGLCSNWII